MIIDGGSCANVASDTLVKKFNLSCVKRSRPYRLQWLNKCGEVKFNGCNGLMWHDLDGSIWSPWIRSNMLRGRNFWSIKTPQNCSWAWGKILKLRSLAWPKMKYIIGDGMTRTECKDLCWNV
jgi:hypothetical protein